MWCKPLGNATTVLVLNQQLYCDEVSFSDVSICGQEKVCVASGGLLSPNTYLLHICFVRRANYYTTQSAVPINTGYFEVLRNSNTSLAPMFASLPPLRTLASMMHAHLQITTRWALPAAAASAMAGKGKTDAASFVGQI